MSLITDALGLRQKKPAMARPARNLPPLPGSRRVPAWLIAVGVACLLVVAVFWKGKDALEWLEGMAGIPSTDPKAMPARPVPAPVAASPAAIPPPKPEETSPEKSLPAAAASPAPAPSGSLMEEAAKLPKAATPAPAGRLEPVVVESADRAKIMDPKVIEQERRNRVETFLAGLRVQGVRIQGPESRIMVDGNLITLGEPIGDFGLRLKSVESGRLVFVDEEGKEYPKSY